MVALGAGVGVTVIVDGTSSIQLRPGAMVITVPLEAVNTVGDELLGRDQVPLISTPLRSTMAGPVVPESCAWTSRPPSEFSSHGP